jgi:hypothetical protein
MSLRLEFEKATSKSKLRAGYFVEPPQVGRIGEVACLWGSMSDNAQTVLVLILLALVAFGGVLSLGF